MCNSWCISFRTHLRDLSLFIAWGGGGRSRGGSSLQIWPRHRKLGHTQKERCPKCFNYASPPPPPPLSQIHFKVSLINVILNTSVYHPIKLKNVLWSNFHSFGAYSTRLTSTTKGKPNGRRDKADLFHKIFQNHNKNSAEHCIVFLQGYTGSNSNKS